MITETGKVVAVSGEHAWVQTIRISACQSCSARNGCGQKLLASATGGRANQVRVVNSVNACVGQDVTLGIEESALLGASMLVYALPLLLMVVASVVGHQVSGGNDFVSMVGAAAGLASGFFISRKLQHRKSGGYEPRLLRVNRIPAGAVSHTDSLT
ncbi:MULTISPECIES: SoxR reducing system RseC family protein [Marinobacter]|uniref:SoxR reducing system RseC family protein n=1 Tax=Marinobacter xiaoshiensis TaxID=3073652 RepID=A0ABU2HL51_9GAMM|nr:MULTISPECIES: SoxR reducing system RseC family protein [unclassified Marinobacter]MBK1872824.1 SoxR reducing system RseC family protein [Marinobacter sp. 1-3A]MDS1311797.1 SoxR reducing system RseC family protein [Marinobacter sp. F60267]